MTYIENFRSLEPTMMCVPQGHRTIGSMFVTMHVRTIMDIASILN